MSSFEGRVFLCPNCGQEIHWYEECEYCKDE